jgi:predicted DNA-binding transcriptional regulator AlpA
MTSSRRSSMAGPPSRAGARPWRNDGGMTPAAARLPHGEARRSGQNRNRCCRHDGSSLFCGNLIAIEKRCGTLTTGAKEGEKGLRRSEGISSGTNSEAVIVNTPTTAGVAARPRGDGGGECADNPGGSRPDPQIIPALLTKSLIRCHYVPTGARTLDRWISAGAFPRPDIAIGSKVRYWKRETVEAWIEAHLHRSA